MHSLSNAVCKHKVSGVSQIKVKFVQTVVDFEPLAAIPSPPDFESRHYLAEGVRDDIPDLDLDAF